MENYDRFGFALARLPDLDGDGRGELAASAVAEVDRRADSPETLKRSRSGYVRVLSSKGNVQRTLHAEDMSPTFGFSLARFPGSARECSSGIVISSAHDLMATIVVSRWNLEDGNPIQRILRPTTIAVRGTGHAQAPAREVALETRPSFATRVLAVPDRDGDGIPDVLVTEPQSIGVGAYVVSSSPSSGPKHTHVGEVLATIGLAVDPFAHSHIGIGLCILGDIDADGVEDFAISGASVRCASDCQGVVVLLSGKSLRTLRHFVRAGRE